MRGSVNSIGADSRQLPGRPLPDLTVGLCHGKGSVLAFRRNLNEHAHTKKNEIRNKSHYKKRLQEKNFFHQTIQFQNTTQMPVRTGCRSSLCLVLVVASSALTRNRAPSSQILVGNVFTSRKCSHCLGKVAWSEKMFSAVEWGLSPSACRMSPNLRVLGSSANVFTFWTSWSGRNVLAARSHRCHQFVGLGSVGLQLAHLGAARYAATRVSV